MSIAHHVTQEDLVPPGADARRPSRGTHASTGIVAGLVATLCLLSACGTPVGVKRMDPTAVQRELTRSVLTSDALSNTTRNALFQHDLTAIWDDDPKTAIATLQKAVAADDVRRNDVFALAEMSFAYAEAKRNPAYYRSAAVYAWLFLFPGEGTPLDALDTRARDAADLYNRSIALGFSLPPHGDFVPRAGAYPVPFGTLDVYFDESQLVANDRRLIKFVPVAELDVQGLATRYRWSGIGAPLAASTEPVNPETGYDDHVQPWAKVPVTALLRMHDVQQQLASGRVQATLTLENALQRGKVDIDGQQVPLETETTAALAYTLAESPVWQREIGGFLQRITALPKGTQLAALQPYRPGSIPVVLVHGTASSPGRWAQMINELGNDRRIGPRVQFWLFTYDTGNPIGFSAMLLRDSLNDLVKNLDPDDKDPALRDMVVMGHSQGGLLTKMMALDSGDTLYKIATDTPLDELDLDPDQRERIRKIAFFKPVPSVKRVIFLSTPHRGSYIAGNWFAHQAARLISFPAEMTKLSADLVTRNRGKLNARFSGLGSSVAGMTPGNPAIKALMSIPIDPNVKANSIIAVTDPDVPLDEADDGVVEYSSAHLDDVESEFVVVSGHSCQDNPNTIQEIRRILREHIKQFDESQGRTTPAAGTLTIGDPADHGATDAKILAPYGHHRGTDTPATLPSP